MGQEQRIDIAYGYTELEQPDGGAATGVNQDCLFSGFDQRGRTKAIGTRDRDPRPKQRDSKRRCH